MKNTFLVWKEMVPGSLSALNVVSEKYAVREKWLWRWWGGGEKEEKKK
jgi:hypothetical protein